MSTTPTAELPDLRTLIPGLTLSLSAAAAARPDAVRLSAGTESANDLGLDGYAGRAFVPRPPWRAPTDVEWKVLTRPDCEIDWPGNQISVFSVPEAVLEPFAQLRDLCHESGNLKRLLALSQDVVGRTALVEAARYALSLADPDRRDIDAPAVYPKVPPGTPTMTTGKDVRLTGLHVDSWYRRELDDRAASPNRISINLGAHDRHLLCVNLPLRAIAEHMAEIYDGAQIVDISFKMPRDFMRSFPDYPVVKLTIAPGEAYVAPTENVIHDGFAERAGGIDLQFTCRGYFHAPNRDARSDAGS
jgi:hypothetical protein